MPSSSTRPSEGTRSPGATARPRALFFCNFPPPYTGQTIGTELVRTLLEERLEIDCLDTSDGDLNLARGPLGLLRRGAAMWRRSRHLRARLEAGEYDVLYLVASSTPLGLLRDYVSVRGARSRVARVVAHVRSGDFHRNFRRWWRRPLARRFAAGVDRFIFLSRGLEERMAPYLPRDRRVVVPNPIDEAVRLSPEECREKIRSRGRDRSLRILYLSNMIPSKGYMDLAAALAVLARRGAPSFHADFAGGFLSSADREAFLDYLRQQGIESSVTVHGAVTDRSRVRRLLAAADVFVLPTYYPLEAQPRSIIEALNAATPVVATRHASIPEYVTDGVNGYLVARRSPEEIAGRLELLAYPEVWRQRAVAARRSYEELFRPDVLRRRLEEAFDLPASEGRA